MGVQTGAYSDSGVHDNFRELGLIASAMFGEVVELHARGIGMEGGPFVLTDDDLSFFCDGMRREAMLNMARSPTFPFKIVDLESALRRAEYQINQSPWDRATQLKLGNGQFAKAHQLAQMVLQIGKRMSSTKPALAKIAFGLSDREIELLADSTDLGLIEAASHIRLEFRTSMYRDVMRVYASHGDQVVKGSKALLSHAVRWVGLALHGRTQEA
jgi:hypothetical protein